VGSAGKEWPVIWVTNRAFYICAGSGECLRMFRKKKNYEFVTEVPPTTYSLYCFKRDPD